MAHPQGFSGTMTALVTPLSEGRIDVDALRRIIEDQLAGGVDVLVPCGTTGEGATLTAAEHALVVRTCVEQARGRARVMAGCGTNGTATTIENVRRAKELGADGALVVTPYYNKPTQEGLYRHFEAVAKDGGLPVLLYNVPSRTSVDLLPDTVARLAKRPGIVGIKEATGSLARVADLLEALSGADFDLVAGDDALTLPMLSMGGTGVISVASNVVPARVAAIVKAFVAGDLKAAAAAQVAINGLVRALFTETNPGPIKAAMALRGLCGEELRLPLVPVTGPTREKVRSALGALGVVRS